ncbi:FAD-dependent oxidoreductase [Pseudomonas sp. R2.Fl]|nr:FAD-dependent oxidoreductase [Pseudomonas sp. R2.Fl]
MLWEDGQTLPEADICIVGAGPVGIACALRCSKLGLRVVLIEAGPPDGPAEDFSAYAPVHFLSSHHDAIEAVSSRGLGGTSAKWGGRCVAFDDLDFEPRPHLPGASWPIGHSELKRYYPDALSFLQCGTAPPAATEFGSGDFTTAAVEYWSARPAIGEIYRNELLSSRNVTLLTGTTVTGISLDRSGGRVTGLSLLRAGRTIELKAPLTVLAGGGLENARLLLSVREERPEKIGGPDGALGCFYQGHLTGYLALIQFTDQRLEHALRFSRDGNGFVSRRRLQPTPAIQKSNALLNTVFWIDAISIADPIHASGVQSAIFLLLSALGLYGRLSRGLAAKTASAHVGRYGPHLRNALTRPGRLRDYGCMLASLFRSRKRNFELVSQNGRYLLRYHAEQTPIRESRATLGGLAGEGGAPALTVDYRIAEEDVASVLRCHELLDRWLREHGFGRLEYLHPQEERGEAVLAQARDGYHQIGLTRMSVDPASGVVDADCRVHDIANLYVAGTGVFPTGGQANPTLPAVALALRLADHLALRQVSRETLATG